MLVGRALREGLSRSASAQAPPGAAQPRLESFFGASGAVQPGRSAAASSATATDAAATLADSSAATAPSPSIAAPVPAAAVPRATSPAHDTLCSTGVDAAAAESLHSPQADEPEAAPAPQTASAAMEVPDVPRRAKRKLADAADAATPTSPAKRVRPEPPPSQQPVAVDFPLDVLQLCRAASSAGPPVSSSWVIMGPLANVPTHLLWLVYHPAQQVLCALDPTRYV